MLMHTGTLDGLPTDLIAWLERLARRDGRSVPSMAAYLLLCGITVTSDELQPRDPELDAILKRRACSSPALT